MLPGQPSLFAESTAPSTSVVGLAVVLPRPCRSCGETMAVLGSSKGPHAAVAFCISCNRHVAWVSKETFDFVTAIIDHVGRPEDAIVVRSNVEQRN
jgi:hypothetical protein